MICAHENQRPGARYCDQCGERLDSELRPLTDAELRQVYCDAGMGAEALRAVVEAHDARLREIAEAQPHCRKCGYGDSESVPGSGCPFCSGEVAAGPTAAEVTPDGGDRRCE